MTSRRAFLGSLVLLGAAPAIAPAIAQPRFARDPFALGVASGYPRPDGMVLWTRLIGDFGPTVIPVRWEIAEDDSMRTIVASGTAAAEPDWAHSVHAEPRGLAPDRWYWYRFSAGEARSPVGRTRTAPAPGATGDKGGGRAGQQRAAGNRAAEGHRAVHPPCLGKGPG